MTIILMGVSGCGKTTLGEMLSERLGWEFSDADGFHPQSNKDKMAQGIALNDDDRWPWLEAMAAHIRKADGAGKNIILACSALKETYREVLRRGGEHVKFVFLKGTEDVISKRLGGRKGHFFNPALLPSQLATLEEPKDAIILDIQRSPEELAKQVLSELNLH